MIKHLYETLFGDPGSKALRRYQADLLAVKEIEKRLATELQTVADVHAKTASFRARFSGLGYQDKKQIDTILEEIKFEAIATHRRACEIIYGQTFQLSENHAFTWKMIPFDVQILGALALHDGNIPEMRTGEGKTLVATIAAYLNALAGIPVHIVTVNPYLAERDAKEMGIIYTSLGLSVGVILPHQNAQDKKDAYKRDVIYATNNELAFDYLRDNMAPSTDRQAIGKLWYAIVDEVDSILIDEARTPLIISAPDEDPTDKYVKFKILAGRLVVNEDYKIDEKAKSALLTEHGIAKVEKMLGIDNIFASSHYNDIHHIENALRAHACYLKDVDYIVRGQEVMIVDEHTGRVLSGRRYSNGLHQALEAKENVEIQRESLTLASVTFQNFFRLYKKLAGMTGTAKTEEEEFQKIYGLDVVVVPTNRPMIRQDRSDLIFKNAQGKFNYLIELIKKTHATGQPILVGTVSVEKSERLSEALTKIGIVHEVLNAKQDAREAEIVARAGQKGAVTIATNMAGRGTDIKIDDEVRALGGLMIIGTEKHETRRIDNQLRGRAGRQGDPGTSQFLVCPQDDIMRIFGGERLTRIFGMVEGPDSEPLFESKFLTRTITNIQKQVEGHHFDIRKHVLEYDDTMNQHRMIVYGRRQRLLEALSGGAGSEKIEMEFQEMFGNEAQKLVASSFQEDEDGRERIHPEALAKSLSEYSDNNLTSSVDADDTAEEATQKIAQVFLAKINALREEVGNEKFEDFRKLLYLQSVDELWMRHIEDMTQLRESVAFEGYNQKNPLLVYKERAFGLFAKMMDSIQYKVVRGLLTARPNTHIERQEINLDNLVAELEKSPELQKEVQNSVHQLAQTNPLFNPALAMQEEPGIRIKMKNNSSENTPALPKVGRNDLCPCGSGKKFKHCHGK